MSIIILNYLIEKKYLKYFSTFLIYNYGKFLV